MTISPKVIAKAWNSITDRWFARQNNDNGGPRWEVIHDWGGTLISDDTMAVRARYWSKEAAEVHAQQLEDEARGAAVLKELAKTKLSDLVACIVRLPKDKKWAAPESAAPVWEAVK